ncbi:MAG: glycerol kinase [Alteromonadaceae bacterium]|nr:MAG: glycerol kinase [Alteromonadaceae bacterium]
MDKQAAIIAIDQGTTSSRTIVFKPNGSIISSAQQEYPQHYPNDGWVEHDPEDIWSSTLATLQKAERQALEQNVNILALGVTNQRETTVIWDRATGKPIYKAIVWQDRRTVSLCEKLKVQGHSQLVRDRTGLLLDPYFSATKIAWILENVEGARTRAEHGELAFGTIDSFLIWRLTGGKHHVTDATNASRTLLFDIHQQQWDDDLLQLFNIPKSLLPEVLDSAANFGTTSTEFTQHPIPILGVAGDQHAATIGQCCFEPGETKCTFGTGCFVLMNTGAQAVQSQNQLLTTIAYRINGKVTYALEGSVFIAGAAVKWLRDTLGLISNVKETETLAASLTSNQGVYLVPAFTGLGAPYWQPNARAALYGLSLATGPAEIARATLESNAYSTSDLLSAMSQDATHVTKIRVDGGMANNSWLMQFLADILNIEVQRPQILETTALGAAYLAGLQAGIYEDLSQLYESRLEHESFLPKIKDDERAKLIAGWQKAVQKTLL